MKLEEEDEESPIHGEILEQIFAHVPLIDLASACHVSKSWEHSVLSSLHYINKLKPWFMIHTQSKRSFAKKTTHAFDPRSNTWIEICHNQTIVNPQISVLQSNVYEKVHQLYFIDKSNTSESIVISDVGYDLPLQSSASNLLYQLCPKILSFSVDTFHQKWNHISLSDVWRVDPIIAIVGPHIIVAGGASSFVDDLNSLSVEMYHVETSHWSTCQSMPYILKDCSSSTWLSVTSNHNKMYVAEKSSGILYSFSPETKTWVGPYNLQPDPCVYFSVIGFAGDDLILAGLIGHTQNVRSLKLWKIKPEIMEFDEIGEIPLELLEKLKGEFSDFLSSISLLAIKDFIYIYNSSDPAEIIFYEFVEGEWKWGSFKNLVLNDERRIGERMVMTCGRVDIADLHTAVKSGSLKFFDKSNVLNFAK